MRKHVFVSLIVLLVVALAFTPAMAADYSIKIGGGPTGGTFNQFTNAMAVYVPKVNSNIGGFRRFGGKPQAGPQRRVGFRLVLCRGQRFGI